MRNIFGIAFLLSVLACFFTMGSVQAEEQKAFSVAPVHVLTMRGPIGPAFTGYLRACLREASEAGAQLLLIELDTPGGLLNATRDMVSEILESDVPVAIYVTPSGGHAASAGTFLLYAAHIAAMNEGTNVGAATPVQMGGAPEPAPIPRKSGQKDGEESSSDSLETPMELGGDLRRKGIEDTSAFIRGLAELRGRNIEWAEKAVTEADSLTAREALDLGVIDLIAGNRQELLFKIDGREITLKNGKSVVLSTQGAPVEVRDPDWKTQILSIVTDPNVAFIFMTLGVYGILLEFYHPGSMVPGTIGAFCLVLGLYALNVLPVNMAGAILMILGIVFLIAEIFVPSFGVLGLVGLAAFLFGSGILFDTEQLLGIGLDMDLVWGMGVSGLLLLGGALYLVARVQGKAQTTGTEGIVDHPATVVEWSRDSGLVRIQGELWKARSESPLILEENRQVLVVALEGLTAVVRPY